MLDVKPMQVWEFTINGQRERFQVVNVLADEVQLLSLDMPDGTPDLARARTQSRKQMLANSQRYRLISDQ